MRRPANIQHEPWLPVVECVEGDVLCPETLRPAMEGVAAVYYLVHSIGSGRDFAARDLAGAHHCANAAKVEGVRRIIYLGGLGDPAAKLSAHLRSRQETGTALCDAGVPVTEFRAAVIIGSGSLSFELIRYLSERLPVMICPRWVYTRIQPIAIQNVLDYLVAALHQPESAGRIIEIGGEDVLSYGGLMETYAGVRGLKRYLLPVPLLTPSLSSYWVRLVTPFSVSLARPLIEGLRNEVIVRDNAAREIFPEVQLLDCKTAVEAALADGEAKQFQVEPQSAMRSELMQTALFEPKGLGGVLYWFFLYPVHRLIFSGMIQGIAEAAEAPVVVLERRKDKNPAMDQRL